MKHSPNILLFFLLCIFTTAKSQDVKLIDSLQKIWNDKTRSDISRIKALHSIGWDGYLGTKPDSAIIIARQEYQFAKSKGLDIHVVNALNTLGASYFYKGNHEKSLAYYNRCLKLSGQINDSKGIANALNNLGIIHYNEGDSKLAIKYYTRSLKIREKINDQRGKAIALNNIGNIYNAQKDHKMAIKYHKRSLAIEKTLGNQQGIATSLDNIGSIYADQGDNKLAMSYHFRSLNLATKLKYEQTIATAKINIADIYLMQGDTEKAISYTKSSLEIYRKIEYKLGIAIALNRLCGIYTKDENYKLALDFGEDGLELSQQIGNVAEIRTVANNLYISYKAQNEILASLEMYELYIKMRDSTLNIEATKEVIRQEINYGYEKLALADSLAFEKKAELNKQSSENQRFAIISGFIVLLIFIGIYIRVRYLRIQSERKELLHQINLLKTETIVKKALSMKLNEQTRLNKEKIETAIDTILNLSDWKILNVLYDNPGIGNKELSSEVALSVAGTRSSLGKMYRLFDIETARNQRFVLVMEATKISNLP